MTKRVGAIAIVVAAAATGLVASTSSGAAKTQRTIGLILAGPGNPIAPEVESGGQAAAAVLGDTLAVTVTDNAAGTIESLTSQDAAAIIVDNESDDPAATQALAQARKAGIPTLSFESHYPGTVWVTQSTPSQYAAALADALASQMRDRGNFIIVPCTPADAVVSTWLSDAKSYIQRRYRRMHRVGVVYGGTGNGPAGTLVLRPLLRKHPHLRGLIFLCPSESFTGPPQLAHLHKVGKIFSAGNGADCPPLYIAYANSVRAGSAEMVCAGDPAHLGYLAVWAADYLAAGYKLAPGTADVGGPVGTVHYYSHDEELRLGQPLTITKANLDQYGISR
jgi:rhamnose transport system substrate-binding protein